MKKYNEGLNSLVETAIFKLKKAANDREKMLTELDGISGIDLGTKQQVFERFKDSTKEELIEVIWADIKAARKLIEEVK